MELPREILELEDRSIGAHGEPTLGRALKLCIERWEAGDRGRELRLHLLFLAWYCNLEPPHLTGATSAVFPDADLARLFFDVVRTFEETIQDDAECLFVIGLMATLTPYLVGDTETAWEARAKAFRIRYRQLLPHGLEPKAFRGRGAYGNYFAGQVVAVGRF